MEKASASSNLKACFKVTVLLRSYISRTHSPFSEKSNTRGYFQNGFLWLWNVTFLFRTWQIWKCNLVDQVLSYLFSFYASCRTYNLSSWCHLKTFINIVRLSVSAKWLLYLPQEADKRDWIWINFPCAGNKALDILTANGVEAFFKSVWSLGVR